MIGDEQFIPADQSASTLGAGVDPASDALMSALSQIRAIQQQPLIADNPMAQLGAGLQAGLAGYRGEVNPAVKEALAVRQQQLSGSLGQAHLGLGIAGLGLHQQTEARRDQLDRAKMALDMSKTFTGSDNPDAQKFGAQILGAGLKGLGITAPPEALADIGQKPLKVDEINAIGKMLLAPESTVQGVAALFKRDPRTVQLVKDIGNSPEAVAAFGGKSNAQLQQDELKTGAMQLDMLKKQREFFAPEVNQAVLAEGKLMDPIKGYFGLSPDDQKIAVDRAIRRPEFLHRVNTDYSNSAIYDKPLLPGQKAQYLDPKTYRPISGELTQRMADVNRLALVDNPADRKAVLAAKTLDESVQEVRDIQKRHPEIFPKTVLNADGSPATVANYLNIERAKATLALRKNIDPDLLRLQAIMPDVVKLATTAGLGARMSNFVAGLEKESAGWMTPGLIEAKDAQITETRRRLNSGVTSLGLNPLPTIITMPDGRRVRVTEGGE